MRWTWQCGIGEEFYLRMMGRKGYEAKRREVEQASKTNSNSGGEHVTDVESLRIFH